MNRAGTQWTEDDLGIAKRMYDAGEDYDVIGEAVGRSAAAAYDMLRKRFGATRALKPGYLNETPIGVTVECARYRQDAKVGSDVLRIACLDLFQRTANRYRVSLADAMACHLGYHAPIRIPGTERVYRGQAAERLAA